jgi:hypothetical protein
LLPPRPHTLPVWAIAVSVALHGVLFLTLAIYGRLPRLPPRDPGLIVLLPVIDEGPREATMPRFVRAEGRGRTDRLVGRVMAPAQAPRAAGNRRAGAGCGKGDGRARGPVALLGPSSGRAPWVRPLPIAPGELARRVASHAELTDSAVKTIVQAFLIRSRKAWGRSGEDAGLDDHAGRRNSGWIEVHLHRGLGSRPLCWRCCRFRRQPGVRARPSRLMREDLYRAARRAETWPTSRKQSAISGAQGTERRSAWQREPPPSDTVHAEVPDDPGPRCVPSSRLAPILMLPSPPPAPTNRPAPKWLDRSRRRPPAGGR